MFRLYLITPPEGDVVAAVEAALAALPRGAAAVQLRQKELPSRALLERARALRAICTWLGAPLLINGRADVALAARADGVHLPEGGLAPADVKALGLALAGVSVHGEPPPRGADFAVFGPVFETPGKAARGLAALRAHDIPVFAVGGIDERNARLCLEAGAHGVACIRSVLGAPDPAGAARRLWSTLEEFRGHKP